MSEETCLLRPIAHIRNDFSDKFGVPRQSGLVRELRARVVLAPEFRSPEALRGIEGFSHLWLIWQFSANVAAGWSPTVRPPRLGGNQRMGVFATRSPFRPNPLGLSCVELLGVEWQGPQAPLLLVGGADLLDGTPIYDIKPYVPLADCHSEARGGFADQFRDYRLEVDFPPPLLALIPEDKRAALLGVLEQDPRPAYQQDPQRSYGLDFAGFTLKFQVHDTLLQVQAVAPTASKGE